MASQRAALPLACVLFTVYQNSMFQSKQDVGSSLRPEMWGYKLTGQLLISNLSPRLVSLLSAMVGVNDT